MRIAHFLITLSVIACTTVALAQEKQSAPDEAILEELRAIRGMVEDLQARVRRIEAQFEPVEEVQAEVDIWDAIRKASEGIPFRGPDLKALRLIKLPDNPTKEQVRAYISDILFASRNQNAFSDSDPQIRMLTEIGPENLDVLLETLSGGITQPFMVHAVRRLATQEHKKMVLDALPICPDLVEVVIANGWVQDARDILINELRSGQVSLPIEWINIVASFRDPSTYGDLRAHLVHGSNRLWTYKAIKNLPDMDLHEAVAEAWQRCRYREWEARSMAPVAVEYGHIDALELLVNALDGHSVDLMGGSYSPRSVVLNHTEARGTNEEIRRWFNENKDRLVFDAHSKKFRVTTGE